MFDRVKNWLDGKIKHVKQEVLAGIEDYHRVHPLPPEMVAAATEDGHSEAIAEVAPPCIHPKELVHSIGGCGDRCGQCGEVLNPHRGPVGISRGAYLRGDWDGRKAKMDSNSFHQARARLLGR